MPDWTINLIYFLLGLGIAVLGVMQNHYYYLKQQQDKFDKITSSLDEIQRRLSIMDWVISEQRLEQKLASDVKPVGIDVNEDPSLTEREKQVFLLVYGQGLNIAEAAKQIGIQPSSLRSHMVSIHQKGIVRRERTLTPLGKKVLEGLLEERKRNLPTQDDIPNLTD